MLHRHSCMRCGTSYIAYTTLPQVIFRRVLKSVRATIRFALSVCPSVRTEQLDCKWKSCQEIPHLNIFRKSGEKIQCSLHSGKNSGHFT
jgi:hypothetical protein